MTAMRSILARSAVCPHALAAPAATAEPIRNSRRLIICPFHNEVDGDLGSGIGPVVPGYENFQKPGLQTRTASTAVTRRPCLFYRQRRDGWVQSFGGLVGSK